MKGRGLRRATADAACTEGGSGKGMGGDSDACLRVYSVSFRDIAQANLSAELVFTELAFLVERYGSEAHVCGFNIYSGGTRIASARIDGLSLYGNHPPHWCRIDNRLVASSEIIIEYD